MSLPTYEECESAVERGDATPLQQHIYDNEPAGHLDVEWRRDLAALVSGIRLAALLDAKNCILNDPGMCGLEEVQNLIDEVQK